MSFVFRPAEEMDLRGIGELYEATRGRVKSRAELEWLYLRNPAGLHKSWVAKEEKSGKIVSARPVFPWNLRVEGTLHSVTQAGDAATHPDFQGRGLFTRLVESSWTALRQAGISCTFSFSNKQSLSVYRKIRISEEAGTGFHLLSSMRRWVRPLRLESDGSGFPGSLRTQSARLLAVASGRFGDWRIPHGIPHCNILPVSEIDDRFDRLWQRQADTFDCIIPRTTEYLQWRFFRHPASRHRLYASFRADGEVEGYAATEEGADRRGRPILYLVEIFASPGSPTWGGLLRTVIEEARLQNVSKIETHLPDSRTFNKVFRKAGFFSRKDSTTCALHVHISTAWIQRLLASDGKFLSFADADFGHATEKPRGVPPTPPSPLP